MVATKFYAIASFLYSLVSWVASVVEDGGDSDASDGDWDEDEEGEDELDSKGGYSGPGQSYDS